MVRSLAVFVLLAALGRWAFGFHVLQPGWLALGTFLLGCFLTAWVVGVAVCALITLFGNRAEAFAWASVNLVLVLAGVYHSFSVLPHPVAARPPRLPDSIAAVARALPLTYFLDAYRAHYGYESEFAAPIATGLALSALYAALAHWAFLAAIQRARRTGLLLKMSE